MSSSRRRRIAAKLLLLAFSLALSVAAGEVAVRLLRPQPVSRASRGLYAHDPPGRYGLRPGHRGRVYNYREFDTEVRINAGGLRGPEIGPRDTATVRIIMIGDSFIFGWGVDEEETVGAALARQLAARGVEAEVIDAGVPGFHVVDEVELFERRLVDLAPDLVLLGVFLGNDLQDADPEAAPVVMVNGLPSAPDGSASLKDWLFRHSQLYALAKKASLRLPGLRDALGLPVPAAIRTLRDDAAVYRTTPAANVERGRQATEAAVLRLAARASERGFRVGAFLIPRLMQTDPEVWQQTLELLELDPSLHDLETPNRMFREIFSANAIPLLDLTPPLSEDLAAGQQVYYRYDRHWTELGNERAAHRIGAFVLDHGLLPQPPPLSPTGGGEQ